MNMKETRLWRKFARVPFLNMINLIINPLARAQIITEYHRDIFFQHLPEAFV
jgi:hypothetical protein